MKKLLLLLTLILFACAQSKSKTSENRKPIEHIEHIFEDYTKYEESTDSKEDQELMVKSLQSLNKVSNLKELELLINVWMYYDPTDFPSGNLVYTILEKSKPESLLAVKARIKNKKEWENDESAPYSELKDLLKQLEKENNETLGLMQGEWFHSQDSLASIKIKNDIWIFSYSKRKNDLEDVYKITFTDQLPEFVNKNVKTEFLILAQKADTLQYEILGIDDKTFSLMHFPTGRIHLYKKIK